MAALTNWINRFPKIVQRADFWCIPASIENMLRYNGLNTITQENLILGYCKNYGNDALLKIVSYNPLRVIPVSLNGLDDAAIIQVAKQSAFKHGNFETFAAPARQNDDFKKANLSLEFIGNIPDKATYFQRMTEAIQADRPVLISVNNGNGTFHIQSVLEVTTDAFNAYDPALNKVESYQVANCVFSNDVLILKSA